MDFLFGRKTPAEMLKQHQRSLTKAQRDLDRERMKLDQQEQKLILDIKKTAKAGQMVHIILIYINNMSRVPVKSWLKI